MTSPWDDPYSLLPEIYRVRDEEVGEPLKAFMWVLAKQMSSLRRDIENLYDDWFVETCASDVLDNIGALIEYRSLPDDGIPAASAERRMVPPFQRREIGDAIRRRRRSGTFNLLAELCRDVTGWPAAAIEGHMLASATADLRQLVDNLTLRQPADNTTTLSVRDAQAGEELGGPFDTTGRLPGVRRAVIPAPAAGRAFEAARAGLFSLTVYVWRQLPYRVRELPPHHVASPAREDSDDSRRPSTHRYTFDWLGHDRPLMTWPVLPTADDPDPGRWTYPDQIGRAVLARDLVSPKPHSYGPDRSFCIWINSRDKPLDANRVDVADLSQWDDVDHPPHPRDGRVLVDPELGRLVVDAKVGNVWVSYTYGFPCDLGGGAYPRAGSDDVTQHQLGHRTTPFPRGRGGPDAEIDAPDDAVVLGIVQRHILHADKDSTLQARQLNTYTQVFATIGAALRKLHDLDQVGPSRHFIVYLAAGRHEWPRRLEVPAGSVLEVRAEDEGRVEIVLPDNAPHVTIRTPSIEGGHGSTVTLCGLLIRGGLQFEGSFETVSVLHSTVVPRWLDPEHGKPMQSTIDTGEETRQLDVRHSVIGAISAASSQVTVKDSVVDPGTDEEPAATVAATTQHLTTHRTTYLAAVRCESIGASDCIFVGGLQSSDGSTAGVSNSYFPTHPAGGTGRPLFDSTRYGDAGYARLAADCPQGVRDGASDHSEMGAYHDLWELYRFTALTARLREVVPVDTDTDIVWRT